MIGLCDEMSRTSRTKIMASRDKPSKGYFSFLNVISSADADFFFEPKRRKKNGGRRSSYWDVERLVERRERNGTVSMFPSACLRTCKLSMKSTFSQN